MGNVLYSVGVRAAIGCPSVEKFKTSADAVSEAVKYGLGFVVEHRRSRDGSSRRTILAWKVQVISYKEVQKKYRNRPEMIKLMDGAKKTDVFVVSPCGRSETFFPFKLEALRMVNIAELL